MHSKINAKAKTKPKTCQMENCCFCGAKLHSHNKLRSEHVVVVHMTHLNIASNQWAIFVFRCYDCHPKISINFKFICFCLNLIKNVTFIVDASFVCFHLKQNSFVIVYRLC